jgi:hypothetical protein
MKQYFLFLSLIGIILFSSFTKPKVVKENIVRYVITDSTPTVVTETRLDSVWVEAGYGWTHHTYHWISAHWQVTKSKSKVKKTASAKSIDPTTISSTTTTIDSTVITTEPKQTKVWIKGHRELVHNNYVWVTGHWETRNIATK